MRKYYPRQFLKCITLPTQKSWSNVYPPAPHFAGPYPQITKNALKFWALTSGLGGENYPLLALSGVNYPFRAQSGVNYLLRA